MISIETMKWRLQGDVGVDLPLVGREGTARVVAADDQKFSLLLLGRRADYTWDRLLVTWRRLVANHELSVAELGGQYDAVGLVSLLAHMQQDAVDRDDVGAVLRLRDAVGVPEHQPTAPTH